MARFEGNISELLGKAFGIYTQVPIYFIGDSKPEVKQDNTPTSANTGAYLFDRFGFKVSDQAIKLDPKQTQGGIWFLPEATVVDMGTSKIISETIMAGRKGSVKELISEGNWVFTFRGFIIGYNAPGKQSSDFPREARKVMKQVFGINKRMQIYSKLVNDLDVFSVVTMDLRFPPMEGYDNVQPYELVCVSDDDIVLDLSNSLT